MDIYVHSNMSQKKVYMDQMILPFDFKAGNLRHKGNLKVFSQSQLRISTVYAKINKALCTLGGVLSDGTEQ